MKKLISATVISVGAIVLSSSPALAHLCQNENKQHGAGGYDERELPNGKIVETGVWADLGEFVGAACEGQETHTRQFLHQAATVGGSNGIQFLTAECREALFELLG